MPTVTNDILLMQSLAKDVQKIIDEVAEYVLGQVIMSVNEEVYGFAEGKYERLGFNGGFIGSWQKEVAKIVGNHISSLVSSDPSRMVYNSEKFQHGNEVVDRRSQMAELIASGDGYDFGGAAAVPRDFWSTIEEMVNDGSLDKVIEGAFTRHGIKFVKNS